MHPILFHIGNILIPSYGALAAAGVLAALFLAQRTARMAGVSPARIWNLCIAAMFSGLIGERLVLIAANWSVLTRHPAWTLGLAMVHHPLVAAAGVVSGLAAAAAYIRRRKLPLGSTADALAAPLAMGLAFEQIGALFAGAGYGIEASPKLPWAITCTSLLAARWSGTPLGIPLHPVQAYAAIGFFTLAIFLLIWMPARRQPGDIAGLCLMGLGVVIFLTETWRDPEGRGVILHGVLDGPQLAAVLMVIVAALVLRERKRPRQELASSPAPMPREHAGREQE
ncbi:MAG: prolipoprotein diacylglyceryl transferase [Acidobacteriota bacterium]